MDRLAEVEERVNKMMFHWNNVIALNRVCPAPFNAMLDGLTYIGIMNVYRGAPEGVEFMRQLEEQLKAKVARGEGRVAEERFRLLFSGTPCYVSMRRLVELFESWGGVFAYSDYLTFASGGMDAGELVYDTSRPLESLAEDDRARRAARPLQPVLRARTASPADQGLRRRRDRLSRHQELPLRVFWHGRHARLPQ